MEPRFKTSFIPKATLPTQGDASSAHASLQKKGSVLLLVSAVLFVAALTAAGALFVYRGYLVNAISVKADLLQKERQSIDPALIRAMARHMARIEAAKKILDTHIAPSVLFAFLEEITLQNVRYQNLSMKAQEDAVSVTAQGEAADFEAVALQSDIYSNNRMVREALFSDVNINTESTVLFNLDAKLDPRFLQYGNYLALRAKGGTVSEMSATAGETSSSNEPVGEGISSVNSGAESDAATQAEAKNTAAASVNTEELTTATPEGEGTDEGAGGGGDEIGGGLLPQPPGALP